MADRALNLRVENARLTAEITALRADLDRTIAERDGARARAEKAEAAAAGLAEALQKLRNEVHGLRAFEFGVRDAISNTNWHVLQLRADEADAALAAHAATGAGE